MDEPPARAYARLMPDANQGSDRPPELPRGDGAANSEAAGASAAAPVEPESGATPSMTGDSSPFFPREQATAPNLRFWLIAVGLLGLGALALGQAELASLAILAGLFAAAHAADLHASRRTLYYALAWVVPALAALLFSGLAVAFTAAALSAGFRQVGPQASVTAVGLTTSIFGGLMAVALAIPRVAHLFARMLFRAEGTSHALRLAARLAVIGALLYVPASLYCHDVIDFAQMLAEKKGALLGRNSLWGNLIGQTLLALGGVGFAVRRDTAATLERLGLRQITAPQWALVAVCVLALVAFNSGAEWLQKSWFPALWESDQRMTEVIAGGLARSDALLLGLSAGIGEEITLRGGLQPRLGIFRTSALFALLHVQYSWYGVLIIFLIGALLGLLRQRTSTSVAIAVHAIYDTVAVLALKN